jgi:hypothetical protein
LAVATVLLAVVAWLWNLGTDDLTTPPTSLDAVAAWIDRHDAVTLAFALVRLEALVLATYLLLLTAVSATARLLALPRATRLVDRLTLPVLRGMFGGAAALGVIAVPGPLHRLPQVVTAPVPAPDGQATLHLDAPESAPAPEPAAAPAAVDSWVVQPGDSLWSIAASHLADTRGAAASDADVVVMWQRLIDLNRDRLVNPDEPDLIFADQVFELPAMDAG